MDERWLLHLPCAGEFIAVLQVQNAMLGRGRLSCRTASILAMALWIVSQFLWGDYEAYSPRALLFNGVRFFVSALLFGGPLWRKLFSVVICAVTILGYGNTLGALTATIWGIRFQDTWMVPTSPFFYGVVLNLLVWLGIRVLQKCTPAIDPRQRLASNLYLCVAAAMNVILTAFGQTAGRPGIMLLICIGLILSVTVYFVMMAMFSAQTFQASQARAQMKIEQERADALMESYKAQRRLTHDFTNHMAAVNFYLDRNDLEGARTYLAGISQRVAAGTAVVNTGNPLLDALLTSEYRKAEQKGVMLHFDLCDLKAFPLGSTDLVTVMCNLMDNAVEGAVGANPPQITLRMKQMGEEYIVSVRNRTREEIPCGEGALPASTKGGQGHGMGLANVCGVLDRCGGEYTLSCKDKWFCFTFTLPAPKGAEPAPAGLAVS